jgi:mono/diheme cytochrome c family protein
MMRGFNLVLLVALVASVVAHLLVGKRDPAQPNDSFLAGMAEPVSYGAFAANPNFPDGKTLRVPAAGTVPRGRLPLHYKATPEDAARAGKELHSPFAAGDSLHQQRGAFLFTNYCQMCHGPRGLGDGPVPKKGFPAPPSLLADKTRGRKDGEVFHILTYGQGNMASYATQLSREDRWAVILHVRALQKQAAPQPLQGKGP